MDVATNVFAGREQDAAPTRAIDVKAELGGDVRRFQQPASLAGEGSGDFRALCASLKAIYKTPPGAQLLVKYKDDEGDLVTMASDQDVSYALGLTPQGAKATLRLVFFLTIPESFVEGLDGMCVDEEEEAMGHDQDDEQDDEGGAQAAATFAHDDRPPRTTSFRLRNGQQCELKLNVLALEHLGFAHLQDEELAATIQKWRLAKLVKVGLVSPNHALEVCNEHGAKVPLPVRRALRLSAKMASNHHRHGRGRGRGRGHGHHHHHPHGPPPPPRHHHHHHHPHSPPPPPPPPHHHFFGAEGEEGGALSSPPHREECPFPWRPHHRWARGRGGRGGGAGPGHACGRGGVPSGPWRAAVAREVEEDALSEGVQNLSVDDGGHGKGHGAGAEAACNKKCKRMVARFVKHVTVPDNMPVAPGQTIRKVWRFRNDSEEPWPANCELLFVGGDSFGAKSFPVRGGVLPTTEVDVTADLVAPDRPGLQEAFFRLKDVDGRRFGQRVWCKVVVQASSSDTLGSEEGDAVLVPAVDPAFAPQLATLREMGFQDEHLSLRLLTRFHGNLERTVARLQAKANKQDTKMGEDA